MFETYSSYIWICYGVTAVALALNIWLSRQSHAKELQATLRRRQMNNKGSEQ